MTSLTVNALTKQFRMYNRPVDRVWEFISRCPKHTSFVALQDISFSLQTGDTVGIIGKNGAGKSTLLKVLAQTLTPTSGSVTVDGRVMALLELGSGFNPEFTGRENIFFNAALLGLTRNEIQLREQEIIDFADLGSFIDRPVKNYSSGMYVRLAFSIATSVDPDILIIDEALSVGDQLFQQKCVRRMNQFKKDGKIILFCSHSMYQVNLLCDRVLWLENGSVKMDDISTAVTRAYEDWNQKNDTVYAGGQEDATGRQEAGNCTCLVLGVCLQAENGEVLTTCRHGQSVVFTMDIQAAAVVDVHFGFAVVRNDGLLCFCSMGNLEGLDSVHLEQESTVRVRLKIETFSLLEGTYRLVGGTVDESGLHFFHQLYSEPFTITTPRYTLGVTSFPHQWDIIQGDAL